MADLRLMCLFAVTFIQVTFGSGWDSSNESGSPWRAHVWRGRLYQFYMREVNWWEAKRLCLSKGSRLVEVNDSQEHNHLVDVLVGGMGHARRQHPRYWIGLVKNRSGRFVWEGSGRRPSFTAWLPWLPDNGGGGNENCVEMIDSIWNDLNCGRRMRAICERRA